MAQEIVGTRLSLAWLLVVTPVCAIAGAQLGHWLGAKYGRRLFERPDSRLFKREYVDKAEFYFNKYGPAKAVVIGGGIVGCSTAYHLAKLGWTDTVLIERHKLTSGSTFHAAGLVGQLRSSANITQLLGYSVELYDRLEQETGLATGWKRNGGLRLACNPERWTEVKRQATTATGQG